MLKKILPELKKPIPFGGFFFHSNGDILMYLKINIHFGCFRYLPVTLSFFNNIIQNVLKSSAAAVSLFDSVISNHYQFKRKEKNKTNKNIYMIYKK